MEHGAQADQAVGDEAGHAGSCVVCIRSEYRGWERALPANAAGWLVIVTGRWPGLGVGEGDSVLVLGFACYPLPGGPRSGQDGVPTRSVGTRETSLLVAYGGVGGGRNDGQCPSWSSLPDCTKTPRLAMICTDVQE
jgi:hypothetical protein